MLTYLILLCSVLCSELRARQDLVAENLALRQQLAVLTRPKRRPRLTEADRLFWSCLSSLWSPWRSTLVLVQPTPSSAGAGSPGDATGRGKAEMAVPAAGASRKRFGI